MSKFTITSSKLYTNFTFENDNVNVNGNYQQDAKSGELLIISGTAYKIVGEGQFIGNFNGRIVDGVLKYTLSDMTRQDTIIVLDAIDEIENYINENQPD